MLRPDLTWRDKLLLIGLIGLMLGVFGAFIYYHISTINTLLYEARIREDGETVRGVVTDIELRESTRSYDSCIVMATYRVDDQPFELEQRTTEDFCSIFRIGSQIELLYAPESPERARLSWGGTEWLDLFLIVLIDLIFVIAGVRIYFKAKKDVAQQEEAEALVQLREENKRLEQGANDAPEIR